jgi:hypothetical protein
VSDHWTEPGRSVDASGRIHYAWPPAGRFHELWSRFDAAFSDDEKHDLLALLREWQHAGSTLVAYTDLFGDWHDVEPDWNEPNRWLKGQP